MTLLLLDDHPLFRKGIAQTILDLDASYRILEANSAQQAFTLIRDHTDIECIFLDLKLPDMDGTYFLSELKRFKCPIPVIVLSANEDPAIIDLCLHSGACGYLTKAATGQEISSALKSLQTSEPYISHSLQSTFRHYQNKTQATCPIPLTRRQRQVLFLLSDGLSNYEIAHSLNISESTVKGHISTLFAILNTNNRTQCINEARRQHLVNPLN